MSNPGVFVVLLQQLAYQAPVLLVYLAGLILALVFLKKTRLPSLLTLLATGSLLLISIVVAASQSYILSAKTGSGWSAMQVGQAMTIIGVTGSFIRAAALGLLVTAVFVDRGTRTEEPLSPPRFGLRALLIGVTLFCLVAGLISTIFWWAK